MLKPVLKQDVGTPAGMTTVRLVRHPQLPGIQNIGGVIREILGQPAVRSAIRAALKPNQVRRFEPLDAAEVGLPAMLDLAQMALQQGSHGLERHLEDADHGDARFARAVEQHLLEDSGWVGLRSLARSEAWTLVSRHTGIGEMEFARAFDTAWGDALMESGLNAMDRLDRSLPLTVLRDMPRVVTTFVPGVDQDIALEDLTVGSGESESLHSTNVQANRGLEALLRLANLSSEEFREAVVAKHGVDPARIWPGDWSVAQMRPTAPAALGAYLLVEILDAFPSGGTPVLKAFLSPHDVARQEGATVMLAPCPAGAPMIGLHNFIEGSCHLAPCKNGVILPRRSSCWRMEPAAAAPVAGLEAQQAGPWSAAAVMDSTHPHRFFVPSDTLEARQMTLPVMGRSL